jgi:hypothetical protein
MLDIFRDVREELKLEVSKNGELVKPMIYQESENGSLCYNSGGRGIIFPYKDGAKRIKGVVDSEGRLTEKVGFSPKNKIDDIRKFAEKKPYYGVNGKPFAVLTRKAAENEKTTLDRLRWFYWKSGLKLPYYVDDIVETGQLFNNEMTCQLYLDLPRIEDDLRVEEFNALLKAKFNQLSEKEIKERERDILKLYHRFMHWHGFTTKCLTECKLLPTYESFVPQNYVISKVRGGYGLFRVDHTSTVIADDMDKKQVFQELTKRISHEQSDGPISTFGCLPTAVVLAANQPYEVPDDGRPLFERCYYHFTDNFKPSNRYLQALYFFNIQFQVGIAMSEPEPIEERFFRMVLA